MRRAIGIEGLRGVAVLLGLAAAASVVMVAVTLHEAPADDVPSGEPPSVPAGALLLWSSLAVLAGTASVLLWSLLPQPLSGPPPGQP